MSPNSYFFSLVRRFFRKYNITLGHNSDLFRVRRGTHGEETCSVMLDPLGGIWRETRDALCGRSNNLSLRSRKQFFF